MADLSPTVGDVLTVSGNTELGVAGEAITAGQTVYKASADSEFYLADCDATTVAANTTDNIYDVYGIALNGAAISQPIVVQKTGVIDIGATVAIGTVYLQSDTAGGIMPSTDVIATNYVTVIGTAITATNIKLNFDASGVAVPE